MIREQPSDQKFTKLKECDKGIVRLLVAKLPYRWRRVGHLAGGLTTLSELEHACPAIED